MYLTDVADQTSITQFKHSFCFLFHKDFEQQPKIKGCEKTQTCRLWFCPSLVSKKKAHIMMLLTFRYCFIFYTCFGVLALISNFNNDLLMAKYLSFQFICWAKKRWISRSVPGLELKTFSFFLEGSSHIFWSRGLEILLARDSMASTTNKIDN